MKISLNDLSSFVVTLNENPLGAILLIALAMLFVFALVATKR